MITQMRRALARRLDPGPIAQIPEADPRSEVTAQIAPSFFTRGESEAISSLLCTIGGLENEVRRGKEPSRVLENLANQIQASVTQAESQPMAQPPPAEYQAMLRLVDFQMRMNGDVYQTVQVPGEILLKNVEFTCDDKGAQKQWEALWHGIFEIDEAEHRLVLGRRRLCHRLGFRLSDRRLNLIREVFKNAGWFLAAPDFVL